MLRAAIFGAVLAGVYLAGSKAADPQAPALSPAVTGRPTFVLSDDPNVVGHIVLHNTTTLGQEGARVVIADTPAGQVVLEHIITRNDACPVEERPCADTLEVIEVPSGYAATPHFLSVEEGSYGTIRILPILGF